MGFATCSPAARLDEDVRSGIRMLSPCGTRAVIGYGGLSTNLQGLALTIKIRRDDKNTIEC
jgi:hypothetical protein